jgi:hypothetical protein
VALDIGFDGEVIVPAVTDPGSTPEPVKKAASSTTRLPNSA